MKKLFAIALVIVMMFSFTAVVFAVDNDSPSGDEKFTIEVVVPSQGGQAGSNATVINKGDTITLTAKPDAGFSFVGWEIDGEYEIISGSLKETTLVIRPLKTASGETSGIIKVKPVFKQVSETEGPVKDPGTTSPETGSNTALAVVFVSLAVIASAVAVGYTGKKYYKAR